MDDNLATNNEQLRHVLLKNPENRSYDDLLVLKGFIARTEFMQKHLAGIINPKQMNDLCRQLGLESYSSGDTVFNQGDIGDKVFILLEGSCDLRVRYRIDLTQGESEIREKFIKTYKERGSYFGERALQFDEPRSGTVISSGHTSLITVNKNSFISVIKEARLDLSNEVVASAEQLGTKESVIAVLSKMRDKRSNQELDAVAGYLFRRIPFFQRFTMPQLIELCRVAETVSVWGRSILFKQGSIGQAFYVVLTGTVEVWVNNQAEITATPLNRIQHKASNDVTDGLGVRVNQLVSGEIFGERALESEDSMRMASIVTCEGNTELIIISREDYHNLVYVMMHADSMNRLTLLRRTDLFRTVDVQHLKSLARFMEPRKYQLNEPLYKVGTKALEIIIIESGECRVETEIREGLDAIEQAELEKQKRNGYLEPTVATVSHQDDHVDAHAHHSHHPHKNAVTFSGRHDPAPVADRSHTPFSSSPVDSAEQSEKIESRLNATSESGKQQASPQKKKKFSLPKIPTAAEIKAKAAAAASAPAPVRLLSTDPVNSVAAKIRMKRLQTQQMIPIGKTHKINLGRIAPNSVLAMYITSGSLADDVFHPETVIASTLVHAYTIGKHDFFNHLPKDTRFAIEKIISEYKAPELTSLWQNNPKKMDEDLWKKEKAWKMFRHDVAHDLRLNSNILDQYHKLGSVHLSANSGNDRYTNINLKNQALIQSRDLRMNGTFLQVDSDWGLRPSHESAAESTDKTAEGIKTDQTMSNDSAALAQDARHEGRRSSHAHARKSSNAGREGIAPEAPSKFNPQLGHSLDLHEKYHADIEAEELVHPLHRHGDRGPHLTTAEITGGKVSLISSAVSHMIRNRLNNAHFGENRLKKELFSIHTEHPSAVTLESAPTETSTALDETALLLGGAPDHGAHAFFLVQIHRESSRNTNGGLLDNAKRMVRCYMRLCGACESTNAAKKLADTQMENIYLTLFRSDPTKEKELILNWSAFRGYDTISLSDTDHFIIYCRGAPVLFASINPSKNIFNAPFPALCKQRGQRYACVVVNKLSPMHQHIQQTHHRHHHHRHHHGAEADSDSDEEHHKKHTHKHHHKPKLLKPDDRPPSPTSVPAAVSPSAKVVKSVASSSMKSKSDVEAGLLSPARTVSTAGGVTFENTMNADGGGTASEYLMEFSVLNEVLLTCSSRLECLKYAITRFGTMSDPGLTDVHNGDTALTTKESEGRVGAKGKIFVKPVKPTQPDRVLSMLHAGKRACVVPLFNWILINDDTTKTLDFTNGFNHASQDLVFLEEELEHSRLSALAFGGIQDKSVIGSCSAANDRVDHNSSLFKSFSEVGLLHSEHQVNTENNNYIPREINYDHSRGINTRSLQLLERDLTSKELSQNVVKQVGLNEIEADAELASQASTAKGQSVYSAATTGTSGNNRRNINGVDEIHLEARLKSLNESVGAYDKLLAAHDKLCDAEHGAELAAAASGTFHGPQSKSLHKFKINLSVNTGMGQSESAPLLSGTHAATVANGTLSKSISTTKTKEIIAKRMNVIESLQNLRFQRVTLENVVEGYNARVNREIAAAAAAAAEGATPMKRSDSSRGRGLTSSSSALKTKSVLSTYNANNSVFSNSGAINTVAPMSTVSVGKRLADSIQLLSDSLAAKHK